MQSSPASGLTTGPRAAAAKSIQPCFRRACFAPGRKTLWQMYSSPAAPGASVPPVSAGSPPGATGSGSCTRRSTRQPQPWPQKPEPPPQIRNMPKPDPDADISMLIYTIPSWVNSIQRTTTVSDFQLASADAKTRLRYQLAVLKKTIEILQKKTSFLRSAAVPAHSVFPATTPPLRDLSVRRSQS